MAKLRYKKLASGKYSIYIDSYSHTTKKRSYEFLKLYVGKDYSKAHKISPADWEAMRKAKWALADKSPSNDGTNNNADPDVCPTTLTAFVGWYYRGTTSNRYFIQHLNRFLKGNDRELESIDNNWVQLFEHYLENQKLASGSIAGYLNKLKISLNKAVECQLIPTNPLAEREIKMVKKESVPYLTEIEVALLAETEVPFNQQVKDAFFFSLHCGMAWANVSRLSPSQITYNATTESYFVLLKHAGSEQVYYIELESAATQILLKYYQKDKSKIFDKLTGTSDNFKRLQLWQALAGLQGDFNFSVAKNTFAMRELKKGIPLGVLRSKMGFQELASVRVYEKMHKGGL